MAASQQHRAAIAPSSSSAAIVARWRSALAVNKAGGLDVNRKHNNSNSVMVALRHGNGLRKKISMGFKQMGSGSVAACNQNMGGEISR